MVRVRSVLPFTEPAVRLKNLSMPVNDRDEGGMGKELMTREKVLEGGGKGGLRAKQETQRGGRGRGQHERGRRRGRRKKKMWWKQARSQQ